jgi:cell division protein FtsX
VNSQTLTTVSILVGIFAALAGVWFYAKSSAREASKQTQDAIDKAVDTASQPLRDQIATLNQVVARRDRVIELRDSRIDSLEDELRRGRGRVRNGQD